MFKKFIKLKPQMDESLKRKAILKTYNDASLTSQEKSAKIAEIMNYSFGKDVDIESSDDSDEPDDCPHYTRGCLVKCTLEKCGKFVKCRLCHPEIGRFNISTVMCKKCNKIQPFSNKCDNCDNIFGLYCCDICHLLISDPDRNVFHCDECGVCRAGSKDKHFHCDKCCMCYPIPKESHYCVGISENDAECPICKDKLDNATVFDDPAQKPCLIKCGHRFHGSCLTEYLKSDYRCPLCRKAIVDLSFQSNQLDNYLGNVDQSVYTSIPEEIRNKQMSVLCYECQTEFTADFSPFQLYKCQTCNNYNTGLI